MRQPVLLCYNLKDESFRKVRLAAMRFKIRIRPVPPAEYGETLAALCGMEPPAGLPAPGTFADEMLVMAHLSSLQASQFLQSLRRLGVPPHRAESHAHAHQLRMELPHAPQRDFQRACRP